MEMKKRIATVWLIIIMMLLTLILDAYADACMVQDVRFDSYECSGISANNDYIYTLDAVEHSLMNIEYELCRVSKDGCAVELICNITAEEPIMTCSQNGVYLLQSIPSNDIKVYSRENADGSIYYTYIYDDDANLTYEFTVCEYPLYYFPNNSNVVEKTVIHISEGEIFDFTCYRNELYIFTRNDVKKYTTQFPPEHMQDIYMPDFVSYWNSEKQFIADDNCYFKYCDGNKTYIASANLIDGKLLSIVEYEYPFVLENPIADCQYAWIVINNKLYTWDSKNRRTISVNLENGEIADISDRMFFSDRLRKLAFWLWK